MSAQYLSFCEEIENKGRRFTALMFKLGNAVLAFFYEGEDVKLGTLAVAMPQFEGKTCISSILLGERNMDITKILAERVSDATKGIVLVSTHLAEVREIEASSALFMLTQKLLNKAGLK